MEGRPRMVVVRNDDWIAPMSSALASAAYEKSRWTVGRALKSAQPHQTLELYIGCNNIDWDAVARKTIIHVLYVRLHCSTPLSAIPKDIVNAIVRIMWKCRRQKLL